MRSPLLNIFSSFCRLSRHVLATGSGPTYQQSVCGRQTGEEDPELGHGLQTDGADLPVPHRRWELRGHQDWHVPNCGPLGRWEFAFFFNIYIYYICSPSIPISKSAHLALRLQLPAKYIQLPAKFDALLNLLCYEPPTPVCEWRHSPRIGVKTLCDVKRGWLLDPWPVTNSF